MVPLQYVAIAGCIIPFIHQDTAVISTNNYDSVGIHLDLPVSGTNI